MYVDERIYTLKKYRPPKAVRIPPSAPYLHVNYVVVNKNWPFCYDF